jgi:hypothetical protein
MMNLAIAPTALYTTNVVNQSTSNTVSSNTPITSSTVGDTFTPSQSATTREGVNFKKLIPTALLSYLVSFGLVACKEDGGKVAASIPKTVLSRAVSCEDNALVIKGSNRATPKAKSQGAFYRTEKSEWIKAVEAQQNRHVLSEEETPTTTTTPQPKEKFLTLVSAKQTGYDSAKCYYFQEAATNKIDQTKTLRQPLKPGATTKVTINGVPVTLIGGNTDIIVKAGGQKVYIPN